MTIVVRLRATPSSVSWIACLGAAVERAGRLVEHQDRRVLEQGAGDRDALLLAARQLEPALADHRFIAVRQARSMKSSIAAPRAAASISSWPRAVAAVGDVVADRVVEQHRVLRDDADRRAQARLGDLRDVLPVDRDAPRRRIVEAEQQPRERRLAGARRPDHRDGRAGGHVEVDALEDRAARAHSRNEHCRSGPGRPDYEGRAPGAVHYLGRRIDSPNIASMSTRPWRIER